MKNGDVLSFQYTGTESNISRVTKQGGQGILGKLEQWSIGVNRFYQSAMNDSDKHQCIQLLIGEHPRFQKPYGIRGILEKELIKRKNVYIEQKNIKIGVLTWNCAGNPPPTSDFEV